MNEIDALEKLSKSYQQDTPSLLYDFFISKLGQGSCCCNSIVYPLNYPTQCMICIQGEETRVSVSGHTSRQVSTDMSQEYAELMAQDNVFQETLAPDEGLVTHSVLVCGIKH